MTLAIALFDMTSLYIHKLRLRRAFSYTSLLYLNAYKVSNAVHYGDQAEDTGMELSIMPLSNPDERWYMCFLVGCRTSVRDSHVNTSVSSVIMYRGHNGQGSCTEHWRYIQSKPRGGFAHSRL